MSREYPVIKDDHVNYPPKKCNSCNASGNAYPGFSELDLINDHWRQYYNDYSYQFYGDAKEWMCRTCGSKQWQSSVRGSRDLIPITSDHDGVPFRKGNHDVFQVSEYSIDIR